MIDNPNEDIETLKEFYDIIDFFQFQKNWSGTWNLWNIDKLCHEWKISMDWDGTKMRSTSTYFWIYNIALYVISNNEDHELKSIEDYR
jgi:hypothetical protein